MHIESGSSAAVRGAQRTQLSMRKTLRANSSASVSIRKWERRLDLSIDMTRPCRETRERRLLTENYVLQTTIKRTADVECLLTVAQ
jgi:hypothetical protein